MYNYSVIKINQKYAREIILRHHYTHAWTKNKHNIGLLKDGMIVGVAVYGSPVGRHSAKSISPFIKENQVLELTRLWVADSEGKNTESWFIGQTFKWIRKHDPEIKALISYSDPSAGHKGTIYQATNWLYQGRGTDDYIYVLNGKNVHPRTVGDRFGTRSFSKLKSISDVRLSSLQKVMVPTKYRYIYILEQNKKERKLIINSLKRSILPYEK